MYMNINDLMADGKISNQDALVVANVGATRAKK